MRDLMSIYAKLVQVVYPRKSSGREVLRSFLLLYLSQLLIDTLYRDWDLWGPFILCLMLGIMLSINVRSSFNLHVVSLTLNLVQAPASQALNVFTSVIVICSLGALTVTVQAKLLGGRVLVSP